MGMSEERPRTGPPPVVACTDPCWGVNRTLGVSRSSRDSTDGRTRAGGLGPLRFRDLRDLEKYEKKLMVVCSGERNQVVPIGFGARCTATSYYGCGLSNLAPHVANLP